MNAGPPDADALLDQLPEMIVVIGGDLLITYVNQRLLDIMGYRREDVLGTNIFDYVHPDDHDFMATAWAGRWGSSAAMASSSRSCTLGALCWRCQPQKAEPSYSISRR